MRLLVRNMSRKTTQEELQDLFESFGSVQSCVIVVDDKTGHSKGFGFVDMPKNGEAKAAVHHLNGYELGGEYIRVKRAKPQGNTETAPAASDDDDLETDDVD